MFFPDPIRQRLLDAVKTHPGKLNLKSLSLALGRNPAYLQQFINRGSPRILPENLRHRLSAMLDIDERHLRQDNDQTGISPADPAALLSISFLDHPSQNKVRTQPWLMPHALFDNHNLDYPAMFRLAVVGDSTADNSIVPGDVVMLDLADRSPHKAGFFGLDGGDHIRVRHVEMFDARSQQRFYISNENSNGGYTVDGDSINVIGRMVFHSRMMVASP